MLRLGQFPFKKGRPDLGLVEVQTLSCTTADCENAVRLPSGEFFASDAGRIDLKYRFTRNPRQNIRIRAKRRLEMRWPYIKAILRREDEPKKNLTEKNGPDQP